MDYNVTIHMLFYNISRAKEVSSKSLKGHIRNYMDYISFLKSYYKIQEIQQLFALEPEKYTNIPQYVYVYIAGAIEIVSKELHIAIPDWVYNDYYFLSEPWFPEDAYKYPKIKEVINKTAPFPFINRNLYISEKVISIF